VGEALSRERSLASAPSELSIRQVLADGKTSSMAEDEIAPYRYRVVRDRDVDDRSWVAWCGSGESQSLGQLSTENYIAERSIGRDSRTVASDDSVVLIDLQQVHIKSAHRVSLLSRNPAMHEEHGCLAAE